MTSQRGSSRPSGERVELYRASDGWRWRYFAGNGEETDHSSEGYEHHLHAVEQATDRHEGVRLFEASLTTEPDGAPTHWVEL